MLRANAEHVWPRGWVGRCSAKEVAERQAGEALRDLDVAGAYNSVLPRAAASAFAKGARFSDEWSGAAFKALQSENSNGKLASSPNSAGLSFARKHERRPSLVPTVSTRVNCFVPVDVL